MLSLPYARVSEMRYKRHDHVWILSFVANPVQGEPLDALGSRNGVAEHGKRLHIDQT